jgi:hypothetical protein
VTGRPGQRAGRRRPGTDFFAELGCQFPQFPFIAHSRGWSAEDMENNEQYVRDSKFLHDGAVALVRRSADTARVMIESSLGRARWSAAGARDRLLIPSSSGRCPHEKIFRRVHRYVLAGPRRCGSAVLAAACSDVGIGLLSRFLASGVIARPDSRP